ncbi:MAG: hypothetical protein SFT68_02950 [Rickettsiaceae bacterium]|nr:hypothetical protein [Rickettsiaceae bacterium]
MADDVVDYSKKDRSQILLNVTKYPETPYEEFIVSQCNIEVVNALKLPTLGFKPYETILLIEGPIKSGKSLLAKNLANSSKGKIINHVSLIDEEHKLYIVDDSEKIPEEDLLHIFNFCDSYKFLLIIISNKLDKIQLKDLSSRIKAIKSVKIEEPDDIMIKMLIIKEFSKRSICVNNDVIQFLVKRIKRNFQDIIQMVREIDEYCLKNKKNVNIKSISQMIGQTI